MGKTSLGWWENGRERYTFIKLINRYNMDILFTLLLVILQFECKHWRENVFFFIIIKALRSTPPLHCAVCMRSTQHTILPSEHNWKVVKQCSFLSGVFGRFFYSSLLFSYAIAYRFAFLSFLQTVNAYNRVLGPDNSVKIKYILKTFVECAI